MSDTAVTPAAPSAPIARFDFRDPAPLTQWVKALLIVSFLADLIATGSGLMELSLLRSIDAGSVAGDIDTLAESNDTRQQAIGVVVFIIYVVTGITFLVWIHRANRNARALGAEDMRFTPGWAVAWYFVPIMSFWKPFQAMREIWQASAEPGNWRAVQAPALLGWWWALYLGNQILNQAAYHLSDKIDSVDSALTASFVMTASSISGMPLDVVGILLVAKIAANQMWQTKTVEVF